MNLEDKHVHTLPDLEKYFVSTQLSNENVNDIFTPIIRRFIIINFIFLLKDYLQYEENEKKKMKKMKKKK